MQNKFSKDKDPAEFPDLCALLSSLVRLMSCYVKEPSVNHAMALVHMMKQIQTHPEFSANPVVEVVVMQAQTIWRDELLQARARCAFNCTQIKNSDGKIH